MEARTRELTDSRN